VKIAELPFHERPVLELLNLEGERSAPEHDYAGYGWARVGQLWCVGDTASDAVTDALVLALHTADDADALTNDIELEFELPAHPPVAVLASAFLERWLPRLPRATAVVLALCNPHRAALRLPTAATAPVWYALGDVTSWLDRDADRIELVAESWSKLRVP